MSRTSPLSFGNRLPSLRPEKGEKEKIKQACEGFEALFLHTLLREGRGNSSISISSGEGRTLGIVRDIQDEAIAKEMAKSGGVGLGQILYRALSKKAQVSSSIADNLGERRNSP